MTLKKPATTKRVKKNSGCSGRQANVAAKTNGYSEQIALMPSLLLAYMYHLNTDDYKKYMSFGYSSKNLEPTILLHTVGQSFLELNCLEYTNIILVADKINDFQ